MKKEDFICPCCGLPNHLEFKSEEDYTNYVPSQGCAAALSLGEAEVAAQVIRKKFEDIKQYSNKFDNYENFEDWFKKEVVCFINEKDLNKWSNLWVRIVALPLEEQIEIQKELTGINIDAPIQEILTSINIHSTIDKNLSSKETHKHYSYSIEEKTEDVIVSYVPYQQTDPIELHFTNNFPILKKKEEVIVDA